MTPCSGPVQRGHLESVNSIYLCPAVQQYLDGLYLPTLRGPKEGGHAVFLIRVLVRIHLSQVRWDPSSKQGLHSRNVPVACCPAQILVLCLSVGGGIKGKDVSITRRLDQNE